MFDGDNHRESLNEFYEDNTFHEREQDVYDLNNLSGYKDEIADLYDKAALDNMKANIKHREGLVSWAKVLIPVYLIVVFIVLCLNRCVFRLESPVLMMILGTTTVNVLGMMYIILKGLFTNGEKMEL